MRKARVQSAGEMARLMRPRARSAEDESGPAGGSSWRGTRCDQNSAAEGHFPLETRSALEARPSAVGRCGNGSGGLDTLWNDVNGVSVLIHEPAEPCLPSPHSASCRTGGGHDNRISLPIAVLVLGAASIGARPRGRHDRDDRHRDRGHGTHRPGRARGADHGARAFLGPRAHCWNSACGTRRVAARGAASRGAVGRRHRNSTDGRDLPPWWANCGGRHRAGGPRRETCAVRMAKATCEGVTKSVSSGAGGLQRSPMNYGGSGSDPPRLSAGYLEIAYPPPAIVTIEDEPESPQYAARKDRPIMTVLLWLADAPLAGRPGPRFRAADKRSPVTAWSSATLCWPKNRRPIVKGRGRSIAQGDRKKERETRSRYWACCCPMMTGRCAVGSMARPARTFK